MARKPKDTGLDADLRLAQRRWERCQKWESTAWNKFRDDTKLHHADAYNGWQWPDAIRQSRELDAKPCLTLNEIRQHNLQILNDMKMNKPAIKYRAAGNGATVEAAIMWTSLAKHIENVSNAPAAYDRASEFMVIGGIGYLRVTTDYESDDSLNQEIFISAPVNPQGVYMDPDCKQPDKSDARFAFIWDDVEKDDVPDMYSEFTEELSKDTGVWEFGPRNTWNTSDKVRVCEYYYIEHKNTKMYLDEGTGKLEDWDALGEEIQEALKEENPDLKFRTVSKPVVHWNLIIGNKIVDRKIYPGQSIPIVPMIGEEAVIDGILDRKGHTRAMIDAQRMYNYWSSAAVEYGALQTKTPWLVDAKSVEGYEHFWETMNTENKAYIPYNSLDDTGKPFTPPQRVTPPTASPVAITGMQIARQEIQMVSGQYENSLGEEGNERTGAAINARTKKGDKATFHYPNNAALAIRRLGVILRELIPHIYDTQRIITVIGEDGMDFELSIDPQQQQSFMKRVEHNGEVAQRILNPRIGKFDVIADVGPGYATKREETFNALTILLTQAPALIPIIGDILLRAADFPMNEEAAARLRRMVPPQALGDGPTQNEQALIQQLEQMKALLAKLMQELDVSQQKTKSAAEKREIALYDALTKRLKTVLDGMKDQVVTPELIQTTMNDVQATDAFMLGGEIREDLNPQLMPQDAEGQPPFPGAKKAPDGEWYVEDPQRPGGWLHVGAGTPPGQGAKLLAQATEQAAQGAPNG